MTPVQAAKNSVTLLAANLQDARQTHELAWQAKWQHHIEVDHPRLQQLINVRLCFSAIANLKMLPRAIPGPRHGAGGSWGNCLEWSNILGCGYLGYPVLALLQPQLGRSLTSYRCKTIEGARRNAAANGYQGACYAWESAELGDERGPFYATHHQRHINGDVAIALWWDYCLSGDLEFFKQQSCPTIIAIAEYYASRVIFNEEEDRYEVQHIFCADENAHIQDNHALTTCVIQRTM